MSPAEELRFLILGAQREGNRILTSLLAPLDLTPSQAEVLSNLADAAPLTLNALGRRLVCEAGSPSRLVSTMVDRGLVRRQEDPGDRRQVTLELTPEGAQLAVSARQVEDQLHDWLEGSLGGANVGRLVEVLRVLLNGTQAGEAVRKRAVSWNGSTVRTKVL